MKKCMDADNLHRRLKKIIGQVQAIDRMVDEDVPCEDVLAQINAAKSALHKVGQVVLEGHINYRKFYKSSGAFCQYDLNLFLPIQQAGPLLETSQKWLVSFFRLDTPYPYRYTIHIPPWVY